MASTNKEVIVIENSRVAPPFHKLIEMSLPLTFFDSLWFYFPPIHSLLFYKITDASRTIIPNLKQSLSAALKYYYPLAGNLILYPSTSASELEIRYVQGDSVPLTIAECDSNFDYFVGKNSRKVREFFPLIPHLPPPKRLSDSMLVPLLALQVTIFPNKGICIGFTVRHVVGDASTMVGFRKAWASINKHGSDGPLLASGTLPFYDRSLIPDLKGLCKTFKSQQEKMFGLENFGTLELNLPSTPRDCVRASFIMSRSNIQSLKRSLLEKHPTLGHVSSFVVTIGYVWTCLAKSRAYCGEETSEGEMDYFGCAVECRIRLDPPLPKTYFGNCLAPCYASIQSIELLGEEGFVNGAKSIGDAISNLLHSEGGLLKDAETWWSELEKMNFERLLSVAGSPKFSLYDIDFGWGKPEKFENGFNIGSIALDESKDSKEGLEICLSLPENKMNAFGITFTDNLKGYSMYN